MPDTAYGAPQSTGSSGGVGGFFADHPSAKWVALGGVVLVAYLWYRNKQAAAANQLPATTATTTDSSGALPTAFGGTNTDLGTIGAPTDLASWTNAALKALGSATYDPAAVENAIYRFTNGLSLDPSQQAIISKVIGVIGNPPGGPFPIVPVAPPAPPTQPPPTQGPYLNPVTWVWSKLGPATVTAGTGLLTNLGFLGRGKIKTPPLGSILYARTRNAKGQYVWSRITSLAQYVNLPFGTQIAALTGSGQAKAA